MGSAEKKPGLREYILTLIVLTLFEICTSIIGASAIFLFVLVPSCLTYIFVRFDLKWAILPIIFTALIPSLVTWGLNVGTFIVCVPMASMLALAIRKRKTPLYIVAYGILGELISVIAVVIILAGFSGGYDYINQMSGMFNEAFDSAMNMYNLPGEAKIAYYNMVSALLPMMILATIMSLAYLSYYISTYALKKRDSYYAGVHLPFSRLKAQRMCILAVLIFFVLSLFTQGIINKTLVNVVVTLVFFVFVCGVSTMSFFALRTKKRISKIIMCILLILTSVSGSSIYILIGFIDAFADFRSLKRKEN